MNAEVHALAGAYALDALPADERDLFRRHLTECSACRQEVDGFKLTAARLGASADQTPPSRLRTAVLDQVTHTRQLPPLPRAEDDETVVPMRRRRTLPLLAAAAALVLVALAGGVGLNAWLGNEPAAQDEISAVVAADDAHTEQAELEGGGTLTLISSEEQQRAVVMAEELPELTPERIYQLWIIDDSGARSADAFFGGSGRGQVHLLDELDPGVQIAITREPQGGSEQPTTDPLGMVALSA